MRMSIIFLCCFMHLWVNNARADVLDAWQPLAKAPIQIKNATDAKGAEDKANQMANVLQVKITELQQLIAQAKAAGNTEAASAYEDIVIALTMAAEGFHRAAKLYEQAATQYTKGDSEGGALNALMGQSAQNCADEVTESGKAAMGKAAAQQFAAASSQAQQAATQCKLCLAVAEGGDNEEAAGLGDNLPPVPKPEPASGS